MGRKKLPSIKIIVEHWIEACYKHRTEKLPIFLDAGEPTCFACGEHWQGKFDNRRGYAGWKDAPLQRAHIIPHSLGGPDDDPSNLVMLCGSCHPQNPHTTDREIYMIWLRSVKSGRENLVKGLQTTWLSNKEDLNKAVEIYRDPFEIMIFYRWRIEHTGFHAFGNKEFSWNGSVERMFPDLIAYIKWLKDNGVYKPDVDGEIEEKINKYVEFKQQCGEILDYDPCDKFNWPKTKIAKKKKPKKKPKNKTTQEIFDENMAASARGQALEEIIDS
jgi:hypothetical protein|tara:strand:+ start:23 stop:841 length:819 start_codon:yes stop_codon:yes gene_type:complete